MLAEAGSETLWWSRHSIADKFSDKRRYKWGGGGWRASRSTLRLVERFTRVNENVIDYQFSVGDPTMFTRPWTAMPTMMKAPGPIFEYACHEGNRAVENTLRGARFQEKDANKAATEGLGNR